MTESNPQPTTAPASSAPAGRPATTGGGPRGDGGPSRPTRRRFGGTNAQIRSALGFYRVMAYLTGTFLILLCIEMLVRYGAGYDLIAGGTDAATNTTVPLGLNMIAADNLSGGLNLSTGILIVHGWLYVLYLIADFRLWSLMRWPFTRFLVIALGGVVPGLSFVMERRIHREAEHELVANPKAARRY
ncbi:hypothetical protein GCM10011512_10560 [Tersicoccus solisilvae]|uniref:DUF3817 domain-containing protein n=1 Tax=Tersicoccus solisilvae TaxID=1882339 RepID=A0ABQ1P2M0_9MICC|nr:hypothetical protein GCM10011512_10560 [Tersicoccus solisilvae]